MVTSNKKAYLVVGLGYGDEGKGLTTDHLCKNAVGPLVIRVNGGQQAGHTVVTKEGTVHVFSNLGSGTFRGISTFWTKYCTFSPTYFIDEYKRLPNVPTYYLDNFSPITTHYDILYNRAMEYSRGNLKHGSCGAGFGSTVNRHQYIQFFANDLLNIKVVEEKLKRIKTYYKSKIETETKFNFDEFDHDLEDKYFINNVKSILNLHKDSLIVFTNEAEIFSSMRPWQTYIFEGAQGILLDIKYGNWPHVTKSNTTSRNAMEIIDRNFPQSNIDIEIFYVSRFYHTRHGAGPFGIFNPKITLKNTDSETNRFNQFQGKFKIDYLNIDLINYSLQCDDKYTIGYKKNLVLTCLDQLTTKKIGYWKNNSFCWIDYKNICNVINCQFESIIYSHNRCSDYIVRDKAL